MESATSHTAPIISTVNVDDDDKNDKMEWKGGRKRNEKGRRRKKNKIKRNEIGKITANIIHNGIAMARRFVLYHQHIEKHLTIVMCSIFRSHENVFFPRSSFLPISDTQNYGFWQTMLIWNMRIWYTIYLLNIALYVL